MRPTERTRTSIIAAPAARPAERLIFARRELLLTSFGDRAKMSPGDQARFGVARWKVETELRNAGTSPDFAAAADFQAERAGIPDPEKSEVPAAKPLPRRRRVPAPA